MNTSSHFNQEKVSVATMFLLLITVAGLDVARFEGSGVPDYTDYPVELVLTGEPVALSSALPVCKYISRIDATQDRIVSSNSWTAEHRVPMFVLPVTGRVNTRPLHLSHQHFMSFNVPHQNADDDAFIFPVEVS